VNDAKATTSPASDDWGASDVDVVSIETAFQGFFRVDRIRLRHRLFAGGWSSPFVREVFDRGHAVAIILYDPEQDLLILVEQFRVGAFLAAQVPAPEPDGTIRPWLIEVVAGIIDEGETAEDVACREAFEEAGCSVKELFFVSRFVLSPGITSETITLYCGRVTAPPPGGLHGLRHEHEDIRVLAVKPADVFCWLEEGRLTNATTLIALQWFQRHHADVRQRWCGSS
jgi:ADP-ribose pyrophosphatase